MTKVAAVSGSVRIGSSSPAVDAVVEVHNSSGDIVDQTAVDAEGRFDYHLSAGTWSLRAWDPHGRRATAEVSLSGGEEKVVRLDLRTPEGGPTG